MTPMQAHQETYGRAVYDARWVCWRACCGQPNPTAECKNRDLHQAIRELDGRWREFAQNKPAVCAEEKP